MSYSRSHLSDGSLLSVAAARLQHGRTWEADHLADIAEIDRRKLYAPAGHSSMHSFCVKEWGLSEDCAFKRIRVARKARRFPVIFHMFADGRLHLTGLVLLAPYLTSRNADELLRAASHKTKREIANLVAERFPKPDVPTSIRALPSPVPVQLAPGPVGLLGLNATSMTEISDSPTSSVPMAPGPVVASAPARSQPEWRAPVTQIAAERFALKLTMSQQMNDDLRYAQELLNHQLPSRDVAEVLHRGLKALIRELEKRKFAATEKPRACSVRPTSNPRHIPAYVKRAVWARDQGRCTFKSDQGTDARRGHAWSTTTSRKWRAVGSLRSRTFACDAGPTTSTQPSARSALASWMRSEKKLESRRRRRTFRLDSRLDSRLRRSRK